MKGSLTVRRACPIRLIVENLDYVRSMAGLVRRRLPAGVEMEDLIAYGAIGLCESARRFDCRTGTRFSTYSHMRIRGAMLDGVRLMGWYGPPLEPEDSVAGEPAARPASDLELYTALRQAVAALPRDARRLIELHYFEDRPLEDCGRALGISKSWASRLRVRALRLLRAMILNNGRDRSGNV